MVSYGSALLKYKKLPFIIANVSTFLIKRNFNRKIFLVNVIFSHSSYFFFKDLTRVTFNIFIVRMILK